MCLSSVSRNKRLRGGSSVKMETLREAVMQRLTAAAEEILGLFEKTMVEFEAEMIRQLKPDISARSPALGLLPPRISGQFDTGTRSQA